MRSETDGEKWKDCGWQRSHVWRIPLASLGKGVDMVRTFHKEQMRRSFDQQ